MKEKSLDKEFSVWPHLLLQPSHSLLSVADGHPLLGLLALELLLPLLLEPQLLDRVEHRVQFRAFDLVLHPLDPLLHDVLLLLHLLDVLPQLAGRVAAVLQRLQFLVDRLERLDQLIVLKSVERFILTNFSISESFRICVFRNHLLKFFIITK